MKIEKAEAKYKPVYVRDFGKGDSSEINPCVKIAIPCDLVTYRPRYKWVDEYREAISQISSINAKFDDLLSDKAKLLINTVKEENDAEVIIVYINTITGQFIRLKNDLSEAPKDPSTYILGIQPIQLELAERTCTGMNLNEIRREHMNQIRHIRE